MSTFQKCVLITGGSHGLGLVAATECARQQPDFLIVIASRTDNGAAGRINSSLKQKNVKYLPLDLASQQNVRAFVNKWQEDRHPPIQALILNAGLQWSTECPKNDEGMDKTFAIAHVGHALLLALLTPYLTKNARIVGISSATHDPGESRLRLTRPLLMLK
jgi:NAD(P)-dependent dehydrogenase (short-subunit alcohol dehydrogenase family)